MERPKYILIVLLFIFTFQAAQANYSRDIYYAYINGDMNKWKSIIDSMEQNQEKTHENLIELTNYQYGYIGWCLGNNKKNEAEKYLNKAEENIRILEYANYKLSLLNSYKSAFYGFRIGLNIYKAAFIGFKSVECAKLAIKQDEKNPFGFLQFGNCQYYMPVLFGGSKSKALLYFIKAEQLMEFNDKQLKYNWNYLSLLTVIGQSYSILNNCNLAKAYYEKALKAEPRFLWVKNELYPELIRKMNEKR